MAKEKLNSEGVEHNDGTYVVKKSRKSSILAFVFCVIIAFFIWAYAEATENDVKTIYVTETEAVTSAATE